MSTLPFGHPAGQHVPWFSFEYVEHVVPDGAEVINYRHCSLCQGIFLADSSGSDICARELCKATKILWAKMDSAEEEQSRTAVA